MQHPDEGTIHGWLDGELSAEEAQALESHVAGCAECSAKVAEARGLIAASSRIVSALDTVPGGVIPAAAKPISRPWYSSVQFRAAAGLLIVAGASALLFSKGQRKAASEAMTVAQPAVTSASRIAATSTVPDSAPVATDAVRETAPRATPAPRLQAKKTRERLLDAPASVTMPSPAVAQRAAPTANEARQTVAPTAAEKPATLGGVALGQAVVTGAMDEASQTLKLVKADTASVTVRNVYETGKGVEVTLVETTLPQKNFSAASASRRDRQAQPLTSAPAPPMAKAMDAVATNSITWSKGDKVFTLTGPMTKAELEALRRKLPEDKR